MALCCHIMIFNIHCDTFLDNVYIIKIANLCVFLSSTFLVILKMSIKSTDTSGVEMSNIKLLQNSVMDFFLPCAGDAYSSGHLVPSLWDLHMFYLLRPILFRTCRYFTGLCSSNIPRYFLDFAFHQIGPLVR